MPEEKVTTGEEQLSQPSPDVTENVDSQSEETTDAGDEGFDYLREEFSDLLKEDETQADNSNFRVTNYYENQNSNREVEAYRAMQSERDRIEAENRKLKAMLEQRQNSSGYDEIDSLLYGDKPTQQAPDVSREIISRLDRMEAERQQEKVARTRNEQMQRISALVNQSMDSAPIIKQSDVLSKVYQAVVGTALQANPNAVNEIPRYGKEFANMMDKAFVQAFLNLGKDPKKDAELTPGMARLAEKLQPKKTTNKTPPSPSAPSTMPNAKKDPFESYSKTHTYDRNEVASRKKQREEEALRSIERAFKGG